MKTVSMIIANGWITRLDVPEGVEVSILDASFNDRHKFEAGRHRWHEGDIEQQAELDEFTPQILRCDDKHVEMFYVVKSKQDLYDAALEILEGRIDYYIVEYDKPTLSEENNMTDEQIAALPVGLQDEAMKLRKRYREEWKWYEEQNKDYTDAKQALKERDGKLAWDVIKRRSDEGHEYEMVYLTHAANG